MPADCGLAFVVVLHLPPRRESRLANILQRHTHLPVLRLRSRQVIEPNHIYVVPPGRAISVLPGCFKIGARELKAPMRSLIDSVFSSLAERCSSRVAGVLFSGADSDGAAGIEHIHRCGGLTLAQDPEEAAHGVMPRAAIAATAEDFHRERHRRATRERRALPNAGR